MLLQMMAFGIVTPFQLHKILFLDSVYIYVVGNALREMRALFSVVICWLVCILNKVVLNCMLKWAIINS